MTKKHYIVLAGILNRHYRRALGEDHTGRQGVILDIAADMAVYALRDNPRFSVERFLAAVREPADE